MRFNANRSIGILAAAAAAALAGGIVFPRAARGGVATLTSVKDNTLYESATGSNSNGAGTGFFAGRTAQFSNSLRRGLVAFDLQTGLPGNATPTAVSVQLTSTRGLNTTDVFLHLAQKDWGEGSSDAGESNDGSGVAATTGDATWVHTFYNTDFWTNAGGDFDATASATANVGIGLATFGPTPRLLADVQGWAANPSTNFGWTVLGTNSAGSSKRFASHENADASIRPSLVIQYSASTWKTPGGSWSAGANWDFGVPGAAGHAAEFTYATGAPGTIVSVNIDSPRTLAVLDLDSPNAYVLSGSPLTIAGPDGLNAINVRNGSHEIAAPLVVASPTKLAIADGSSLKLSGEVTGGGKFTDLAVAPTGRLDLTHNRLVTTAAAGTWDGSAYTGVAGLVDAGRGDASNAQWDGGGIVTSDTRAVDNNDLVSIGTAKVGALKGIDDTTTTTFAGQTVLGSDAIAMVTWGGDANLDGKINIDDYGQIDFNVSSSGSVFGWFNGDFNYDGKINIDDYGIIDFNVNAQTGMFPTAGGVPAEGGAPAVPEPGSMALACLATSLILVRPTHRRARRSTG